MKALVILIFAVLIMDQSGGQVNKDSAKSEVQRDSSEVKSLLLLYKESLESNSEASITSVKKAFYLASDIGFERGIIESSHILGEFYYSKRKYDSAFQFFTHELDISEHLNFREGIMNALTGQGRVRARQRMWKEAIQLHTKCVEMGIISKRDSSIIANNHNQLGSIYLNQHQYDKALDNYQKGSNLIPGVTRTKVAVVVNMGIIYRRLKEYDKANTCFLKGVDMAKTLNNTNLLAHCYQKLGSISRDLRKLDDALQYFSQALDQFKMLGNKSMIGSLHSNLGDVFVSKKLYDKAKEEYIKSIPYLEEVDDQVSLCYSYSGLGITYTKLGDYSSAITYLSRAKDLSKETGVQLINMETSLALSDVYVLLEDFEKAFYHHKEYKSLSDSILDKTKTSLIAEMDAKYETAQKEKEIELLNAQNEINDLRLNQRENQRNILIATAIVFMILAGILYKRFKTGSKTNKKLKELDELKTRFFTNISHEFRTPLTLILGPVVQKLSSESLTDRERNELSVIKQNADRLLELINQLLDLAKLEAGKLKLQVFKGDFTVFMKTLVSSFESLAEQKQIQLSINFPKEGNELLFDTEKCQQIFYNLLSNSFKFTPPQGEITIDLYYTKSDVFVKIADTGKGIPEKDLPNIFKRFHQLEDSKHHQKGTGIGLALVKELVALHHGEISVSSTINKGTAFTVSFPLSESVYKNDSVISHLEISHPSQSMHQPMEEISSDADIANEEYVLIIEDNDDVRNYLKSILSETFHVIEAADGKEGHLLAIQKIPDLIVSDLMMPIMDGIELCNALKQDEKTSHIPIIMLTAKADDQSKMDGLETGADDYLVKPFNEKVLKTRVKNLIEQRKKLREKYSRVFSLEPNQIEITPPDKVFMKRVMELIESNISNYDFSVEDFQKEMAMSRMQLHRKLKALTDCSASEFVRKQRLKRAAQILKIEGTSVSEAAYSSGFSNLSYFAKCFKEEFGKNPSNYHQ